MLECWGGGFGRHCTTDIWGEIPLYYVHYLERLKERRSPLEFKLLLFCSINDWMATLSSHSFSNMLGISVLLDDFISNSCTLPMSLGCDASISLNKTQFF